MLRVLPSYVFAILAPIGVLALPNCTTPKRVPTILSAGFSDVVERNAEPALPVSELRASTGRLSEYLSYAVAHNPQTRAAFESWRASRFAIRRAGRLPEPSISLGYYLRSVETRVGPQRYKVGIAQTFPWPGTLEAGQDALRAKSLAKARVVDANVLSIARDVAKAYWTLWLIDEEQRLTTEHDAILEGLAAAVRGRLQTGDATLADLNQINLLIARHHDHEGKHREAARRASAQLRASLGAPASPDVLLATDSPGIGLPATSEEELASSSRSHPLIEKFSHLEEGANHEVTRARAYRYPRFRVGLDLIGTGEAADRSIADSGKDALIISAGLSVPLWASSYSDAEAAARATAKSHQAMREAGLRQIEAALASALAQVRDAQRRIELYQATLVPQAETTFQAVLGGYQIGRTTVAAVIIAQRDLIELRLEHARARATRASAWAELEYVTGRHLAAGEASND